VIHHQLCLQQLPGHQRQFRFLDTRHHRHAFCSFRLVVNVSMLWVGGYRIPPQGTFSWSSDGNGSALDPFFTAA
jgi:hypothetical protein